MGRVLDMRGAPAMGAPPQNPIPLSPMKCPRCHGEVFQLAIIGVVGEDPISHLHHFQERAKRCSCIRCNLILPTREELAAMKKTVAEAQAHAGIPVDGGGSQDGRQAAGG